MNIKIKELIIPTSGDEWTNKIYIHHVYGPLHYTRIIFSWIREGGEISKGAFYNWLTDELELPKEVADDIYFLATNGKMELESSARKFMISQEIHESFKRIRSYLIQRVQADKINQ